MVRPMGENGLVMEQLHYPDELRSFAEVPIEDATVKPAELKLATQLIEQAASDEFAPENYRDEVRERMLELINRKVEGEDITIAPTAEPEHKIIDIMEALKASLAAGNSRKPAQQARARSGKESRQSRRPPRRSASPRSNGDAMKAYSTREVADLLGISRAARALPRALGRRRTAPRVQRPLRVLLPGPRVAAHGEGPRGREAQAAPDPECAARARRAAARPTGRFAPCACRSTAIA